MTAEGFRFNPDLPLALTSFHFNAGKIFSLRLEKEFYELLVVLSSASFAPFCDGIYFLSYIQGHLKDRGTIGKISQPCLFTPMLFPLSSQSLFSYTVQLWVPLALEPDV